jgi:uncharacterized protein YbjQ (UPF0145 family)
MKNDLLLVTTTLPEGYKIEKIFGLVTGVTSRTRGIGGNIIASLQSLGGGEVTAYTSEIEKARFEAIERMKDKALSIGANCIVGIDIETTDILSTVVVVSATGTAMMVEKTKN